MKLTARVLGDVARYYRSNNGKAALAVLSLAILGITTERKALVNLAIGAFGGAVLPPVTMQVRRLGEQQEVLTRSVAGLTSKAGTRFNDRDDDRRQEFETDVIMSRAHDLTRFDEIEARLARLEARH